MLDRVDRVAKLLPDMAADPHFYATKAAMRAAFPLADMIEVVPGDHGLPCVRVLKADGSGLTVQI